jgi:hypothetical protein
VHGCGTYDDDVRDDRLRDGVARAVAPRWNGSQSTRRSRRGCALTEHVSPEVRAFLAQHVDAPEHLDILLLLRAQSDRDWSPEEVAQAVYTVASSAERRLERLLADGLAVSSGGPAPRYRYRRSPDEEESRIDRVDAAYRTDRAALMRLVLDRAADPLRQFSDAFRIRRDDR